MTTISSNIDEVIKSVLNILVFFQDKISSVLNTLVFFQDKILQVQKRIKSSSSFLYQMSP